MSKRSEALSNPSELWNNMTAGYREDMANGNDARVAGRAAFDLSTLLVPGGAATKTSRATAAWTAQSRATAANATLPASMSKKTVAAVGGKKTMTLSGWSDDLPAGLLPGRPGEGAPARGGAPEERYWSSHDDRLRIVVPAGRGSGGDWSRRGAVIGLAAAHLAGVRRPDGSRCGGAGRA